MENLCGKPMEHYQKHLESGRRLIDNKPQRCTICDGFGYRTNGACIEQCHKCGGTGKGVNV